MKNALDAFRFFELWLSWYPGNYKAAVAAAGDFLETEADFEEFRKLVEAKYKPI
jgi:hypothetical protein